MFDPVEIGRMIALETVELTDQGAFVDAGEYGPLFVPKSQLPSDLKVHDPLKVFLYQDRGRVLATARRPYLELGMTGRLKVSMIDNGTVYLDLGIPKELVVPYSEQRGYFEEGAMVTVYVAIDDKGRLFGTQRFNRYIYDKALPGAFKHGQKVRIVPLVRTPLGIRVIVEDQVYGLLYASEQKGGLTMGKRMNGYIKLIRPDGRLDITLQEPGRSGVEHGAFEILKALCFSNGKLDFNDKSSPQEIEDFLHMSKSRFKQAIGYLYRQRFIIISDDGITLTEAGRKDALEHGVKLD